MSTRKTPPAASSADDLQSQRNAAAATLLRGADTQQANGLNSLSLIQQARVSRLTRSAAAQAAASQAATGQTSAVQSSAASTAASPSTALATAQTASARLAIAHQQVTTTAPKVAATGWALHGRVYDSALNPLAKYSVYLTDGQKIYQSAYGVDYTDATGYFLINYPGDGAAADSKSSANATKADSAPELYLQIADAKGSPVYASAVVFTPTAGAATYQIATLPDGDAPIGNPPAQVRAAVLPTARKPKS